MTPKRAPVRIGDTRYAAALACCAARWRLFDGVWSCRRDGPRLNRLASWPAHQRETRGRLSRRPSNHRGHHETRISPLRHLKSTARIIKKREEGNRCLRAGSNARRTRGWHVAGAETSRHGVDFRRGPRTPSTQDAHGRSVPGRPHRASLFRTARTRACHAASRAGLIRETGNVSAWTAPTHVWAYGARPAGGAAVGASQPRLTGKGESCAQAADEGFRRNASARDLAASPMAHARVPAPRAGLSVLSGLASSVRCCPPLVLVTASLGLWMVLDHLANGEERYWRRALADLAERRPRICCGVQVRVTGMENLPRQDQYRDPCEAPVDAGNLPDAS